MTDSSEFRVLLVDDEPVICELIRTMLASASVEVEIVPDGIACIKAARTKHYDLVLLDIVLPGIDGIAVCRLLKADPSTSAIPVYMLTAKAKHSDIATAKNAGADGYINKPFKGAELTDLVASLKASTLTRLPANK